LHVAIVPGFDPFLSGGTAFSVLENSILIHEDLANDPTPAHVKFNPAISIPRYFKDDAYVIYRGEKADATIKLSEFFVLYDRVFYLKVLTI